MTGPAALRAEGQVEVEVGGVQPLGVDDALGVFDGGEDGVGALEFCGVFDGQGHGVEGAGLGVAEFDFFDGGLVSLDGVGVVQQEGERGDGEWDECPA